MILNFLLTSLCVVAPIVLQDNIDLNTSREKIDLNGAKWNITLDPEASWENDELFLPPINIDELPVNIPTGGWKLLENPDIKEVSLPATIEEHLWGYNGEKFGVTGNYIGVSWFETSTNIPVKWKGRRITLNFEAIRFRAEIFINQKLVGYDLVNCTPFSLDVSKFLRYGEKNIISVRITDPNGNFNWKDSQRYTWGNYLTNPSHGFGGIIGDVSITAMPNNFISDIFVKNTPNPHKVDVEVSIEMLSQGNLPLELSIFDKHGTEVYHKTDFVSLSGGYNKLNYSIELPQAKLWSVEEPNLYKIKVKLDKDSDTRRFGFRWFEVRTVNGDKQFYLNGKRIVLRTAISWGYWPYNGIMPSDSLAKKQILAAKRLGLNMLNFHRAIGQTKVLDYADEIGLLYWEEPGGNQYPASRFNDNSKQSLFYIAYRNEKLRRMIMRDRSHPSLIIYNMHNERGADPQEQDYEQMRMGHKLDPTRILVYNSCNGENLEGQPDARFKTHLMPYDTIFYDNGWWDNHRAGGPGVYHDAVYESKNKYLRSSSNKEEIVFWGEDGAIGTPPRLSLIKNELLNSRKLSGWEAEDYLKWYASYDNFLKNKGFIKAFPSVDSLTKSMGNVAYYYQGRVIENIRINNIVDGYAINGWESMKLENHSGIVDIYRNFKGDPNLIAKFNKPLVLSVKLNSKVISIGQNTIADVFIINEQDLKGRYALEVECIGSDGTIFESHTKNIKINGGIIYGECLADGMNFKITEPGYTTIRARLKKNGKMICEGSDEVFAVQLDTSGINSKGSVADTTKRIQSFMSKLGIKLENYTSGIPKGDYLIIGAFEPLQWGSRMSDIMEWVYKGHTLIIIDNPERWAEFLADKEVLDYRGSKIIGTAWYGGNFFNREHPIWEGLPQNCVFNWEYQCFAAYNRRRIGLRCENGEILAAAVADHKKEVFSVLNLIRAGRGQIIITTLDIPACLGSLKAYEEGVDADGMYEAMTTFNISDTNKANIVGQKLLLNMIKLSLKQNGDNIKI